MEEALRDRRKRLVAIPDQIQLRLQFGLQRSKDESALRRGIHQIRKRELIAQPLTDEHGGIVSKTEGALQTEVMDPLAAPARNVGRPALLRSEKSILLLTRL